MHAIALSPSCSRATAITTALSTPPEYATKAEPQPRTDWRRRSSFSQITSSDTPLILAATERAVTAEPPPRARATLSGFPSVCDAPIMAACDIGHGHDEPSDPDCRLVG